MRQLSCHFRGQRTARVGPSLLRQPPAHHDANYDANCDVCQDVNYNFSGYVSRDIDCHITVYINRRVKGTRHHHAPPLQILAQAPAARHHPS